MCLVLTHIKPDCSRLCLHASDVYKSLWMRVRGLVWVWVWVTAHSWDAPAAASHKPATMHTFHYLKQQPINPITDN